VGKQAREVLERCNLSFMGNSGRAQKTRMLREMQMVKTVLVKFQKGMKTLLGIGLETICYILAKNLSTFCLCPETL
jgi:hypothetical protein